MWKMFSQLGLGIEPETSWTRFSYQSHNHYAMASASIKRYADLLSPLSRQNISMQVLHLRQSINIKQEDAHVIFCDRRELP